MRYLLFILVILALPSCAEKGPCGPYQSGLFEPGTKVTFIATGESVRVVGRRVLHNPGACPSNLYPIYYIVFDGGAETGVTWSKLRRQ